MIYCKKYKRKCNWQSCPNGLYVDVVACSHMEFNKDKELTLDHLHGRYGFKRNKAGTVDEVLGVLEGKYD